MPRLQICTGVLNILPVTNFSGDLVVTVGKKAKLGLKGYIIIAVFVILIIEVILFSIGSMTTGVSVTAGCDPHPEYQCVASNNYSSSANIATFQIGQNTDNSWQAVKIMLVETNQSGLCSNQTPPKFWNSTTAIRLNGTLLKGSIVSVKINMSGQIPTGALYDGCLWASYELLGYNQTRYAQIGTVFLN